MNSYLSYASDALMIAASLGAAVYCLILSRRLSRLTSFDKGIGGAIAVLSAQVDEMKGALAEAKSGSEGAGRHLQGLVQQARDISGELELMIAACHDFAEEALVVQGVERPVPDKPMDSRDTARTDPVPTPIETGTQDLIADTSQSAETVTAELQDPPGDETGDATPIPIFGTRRSPAPEPVFRRHAQV